MFPANQIPPGMNGNAAGFGSSSSGLSLLQGNMMESQLHRGIGGSTLEGGQMGNIMDGHHLQMGIGGSAFNGGQMAAMMMGEEDVESQSESENQEGTGTSDDQSPDPNRKTKGKRYHRHTSTQIEQMELFFKECPHPDDKQRKQLGIELGLEPLQVKFWFQNKRTQMKTLHEREENTHLRHMNEKLRMENIRFKDALNNATCPNCGEPATVAELTYEEHQLRAENIRLRAEIDRIMKMATKYIGKPMPSNNNVSPPVTTQTRDLSFGQPAIGGENMLGVVDQISATNNGPTEADKQVIFELAVGAMEEIMLMARIDEPLWNPSIEGTYLLNEDEYMRTFSRGIGPKPLGFKSEASRESVVVMMNHTSLVDILMDAHRWTTMFSSIVLRAMTLDILLTGNYNGALQVMTAEFQVPSPLVPTRECYFLRFCKQHGDGMWTVVDVSLDQLRPNTPVRYRRRPSGCLIQEMPNGFSKVIWVEHVEVDDRGVHNIYMPVVNTGLAFGAKRWIGTLDRQCERLASAMSMNIPANDFNNLAIMNQEAKKSMLKLAERMVINFCAGVSASTVHTWTTVPGSVSDDVRLMTRKNVDDPGRPPGVTISATTSFWVPVPPRRVFDFLRDENFRSTWDILSNGGITQEMAHIANGRDPGNCISILGVDSATPGQTNMLILQESYYDPIASYVVYAPVDIIAMNVVLAGGDPDFVALLPSGFAILPDGPPLSGGGLDGIGCGGSLLTVGFQVLVDSRPSSKITEQNVTIVNTLMASTVERIRGTMTRHYT